MGAYLSDAIRVYMNDLIDWETTLRLRKGADVDVDSDHDLAYPQGLVCS